MARKAFVLKFALLMGFATLSPTVQGANTQDSVLHAAPPTEDNRYLADASEPKANVPSDTSNNPAEVAPAPEKQASPVALPWLSTAERNFLEQTGGLQPIATYAQKTGVVTIKLKKTGLTADEIFDFAIGPKYDYYKNTDLVETSFRGTMNGQIHLFTATVAKLYTPLGAMELSFVPVVTRITREQSDDRIIISWTQVGEEEAKKFVNAHEAALLESMQGAGVNTPIEKYKKRIFDNLGEISTVKGRHDYQVSTGYYLYQQEAVMSGAITQGVASRVGEADITGAALKIAYQMIKEPAKAGAANKEGPKVTAMDGSIIAPGR